MPTMTPAAQEPSLGSGQAKGARTQQYEETGMKDMAKDHGRAALLNKVRADGEGVAWGIFTETSYGGYLEEIMSAVRRACAMPMANRKGFLRTTMKYISGRIIME